MQTRCLHSITAPVYKDADATRDRVSSSGSAGETVMQWVLRASLILVLILMLHTTRTDQAVREGRRSRPKGKAVKLVLDPAVLNHGGSRSAPTIANMSLAPWTYRDSSNDSRLPTTISHAQCLTSGCLSLQGEGEDVALVATPIYYQVLVLHKVPEPRPKKGGRRKEKRRHHFRLGTEEVAVGCTCVRPSLVPQQ